MPAGPMTILVLLVAGVLIIAGVLLLRGRSRAADDSAARNKRRCSRCRYENVGDARFCARCGGELTHREA